MVKKIAVIGAGNMGTALLRGILVSGWGTKENLVASHPKPAKRAEADVHFACEQGREISDLIATADASGERQNLPVHVVATVPKLFASDPVARFTLTLSVKRRETAGPGHNRGREG